MPSQETFWAAIRHFLKPILALLDDPTVTEILINGPGRVVFERGGTLHTAQVDNFSEAALEAAVINIAEFVDRPLDVDHPALDARLPDGSRVHVLTPPCSRAGICLSIRKFTDAPLTLEGLIERHSITAEAAEFLEISVGLRKSLAVCGAAGTGKTSFLNAVSGAIPESERIIVLEDSSELKLKQERAVYLETRPPGPSGAGGMSIRELFANSLRMRPDRIVIGEVRRAEALDLVQAALAGHAGTLASWHAEGPLEAALRLETLCLMGDVALPAALARAQVAQALDLVICLSRDGVDGRRRVKVISEIEGLDTDGRYVIRDLFRFEAEGRDHAGVLRGELRATGLVPTYADEPERYGMADRIHRSARLFRRARPASR